MAEEKNQVDNVESPKGEKTANSSEGYGAPRSGGKDESYYQRDYYPRRRVGFFVLIVLLVLIVVGFFGMAFARFGFRSFGPGVKNVAIGRNLNGRDSRGSMMGMRRANVAQGKVTAVNGQTFTMDVNGNSKSVQINSDTRFPINSATKVNTGDTVIVWGGQDSNGVIQATQVAVNPTNGWR